MIKMSNWTNLNLFLSLDDKYQHSKRELTELLISAVIDNNKDNIISLIQKGAFINSFTEKQSPLIAALEANHIDLTPFLLKIGANPSVLVNNTDAVWMALEQKKYDFLNLFFSKKTKFNYIKETGETLLIRATKNSDLAAVEIIAYKVNVNDKDHTGSTALHYNFSKENPSTEDQQIGKILLQCGADTNSQNNDGISCNDLANNENESILENHKIKEIVELDTFVSNDDNNDYDLDFDNEEPEKPKKFKL